MKIYTLLYEFESLSMSGCEICGTAYTDREKMEEYIKCQIEAVKSAFIRDLCCLEDNDDKNHINENYGTNCWSITNERTKEFASLTINEIELITE